MKVGLIGLSLAGKTAVFRAVTGVDAQLSHSVGERRQIHQGVVPVPDERLERLGDVFEKDKRVSATVELLDQAGIHPGSSDREGSFDQAVRAVDALGIVIRVFSDPAVPHPMGKNDPTRDLRTMADELVLTDLEVVEKRIDRIARDLARGRKDDEREYEVLVRCRAALNDGRSLRQSGLSPADLLLLKNFAFLTAKPTLVISNVGEDGLAEETSVGLRAIASGMDSPLCVLAAGLEMELTELDESESASFRSSYELEESARELLVRTAYETLDVITFYTVGDHEVRAWTLERGGTAVEAAGKVHTDMARGFIRAEVIHYDEFMGCGSVAAAREKGLYRMEGRDYDVKDGDILYVRFSR